MRVIRTCVFCETDFERIENGLILPLPDEGGSADAWLAWFLQTVFCGQCVEVYNLSRKSEVDGETVDLTTDLQRIGDTLVDIYKRGRRDALDDAYSAIYGIVPDVAGASGIRHDYAAAVSSLRTKSPRPR